MVIRPPSRKAVGIAAALFLTVCLLAWLAVPGLVQTQAQRYVVENTGHRLTMDKPGFNPFTLALTLRNVDLREPDGKPLLVFRSLEVNVSATSLPRAALVFDAIRLDGLRATVAELPGDRLNWSALIDAFKGKDEPAAKPAGLPRIDINLLSISDGRIDVADRRSEPERSVSVDPIDIELENLSTLPNDQGRYEITARTGFAERIEWHGELTLNPLAVEGSLTIGGVALNKLAALAKLPDGMAAPEGTAALTTRYKVVRADDRIDLSLDQLAIKLEKFVLRGKAAAEPLLVIDSVEARDGKLDLREHRFVLGSLAARGGDLNLVRATDGRLNILDLFASSASAPPASPASAAEPAAAPWHYRIRRTTVTDFRTAFRDLGVAPAAEFVLADIDIGVDDIADDPKSAWPLRARVLARTGGELAIDGKLTNGGTQGDLHAKLAGLSLKPLQPYLGATTTLMLADGLANAEGRVQYGTGQAGYQGSFALQDLALVEGEKRSDFLKWKSLGTRKLSVTPARLAVGDLVLDGLDTRLIIDADKSANFSRVVRKQASAPASQTQPGVEKAESSDFQVSIDRLRITRGQLLFADYSLALPFGTNIRNLNGSLDGLGNVHGRPGQLELDGEVDDYGQARAFGGIDLFKPTDFTDVTVTFRNVDMPRLTPYSATFAGRRIDSGKLSLDLQYRINQRQLSGDNLVVIDSLTLGERVESPQAKDLPLDLAIAILQDGDGRIDLGVPVSGNLDDPEFSYGQIVWKAFINVIGKVITSPFRALGSLLGGDEGIDAVAFEAGQSGLTAPEREKLTKLAGALGKRPKLALDIHGVYAGADRLALQDLQLRRALAASLDRPVEDDADPGPMATDDPKVQAALETLFAQRFGGGELAALREGFRQVNPERVAEAGKDKVMSRLAGLFREKQTLSESDLARLKGADLHVVLYEKLRDKETVSDDRLRALAKARGEAAMAVLKAASAPLNRIGLLDIQQVEAADSGVPLKMDVKTAP
jgi:hypothetical protein